MLSSQAGLAKMIQASKTSGKLNVSSRGLSVFPDLFSNPTSVSGSFDDQGWWEIVDLTRLVMADNALESIDPRVGELGALIVFDLHNNRIASLPDDLAGLESLSLLNLAGNLLRSWNVSLCSLPLVELNLASNLLGELPIELGHLTHLTHLNLSGNQLTGLPSTLSSLERLLSLNVANNQLLTLNDIDWTRLSVLQELYLGHNGLETFPDSFQLNKLQVLDLKNNSLNVLSMNCPALKDLCLAFNHIKQLDNGSIGSCVSLQILDLRDNHFLVVPEDVLCFKQLKRLDLSNNDISKLPPLLGSLEYLSHLQYSGNPLRGLPTGGTVKLMEFLRKKVELPTESQPALYNLEPEYHHSEQQSLVKVVDWSSTNLHKLDTIWLERHGSKLLQIKACNNLLTELVNLSCLTPYLQHLDVSKNRITCLPPLALPYLQTLNVSRNNLKELNLETCDLPCLIELSANMNQIESIHLNSVFPHLSSLLLSDNKIQVIDPTIFLEQTPMISILDLSNNQITNVPPTLGLVTTLRGLDLNGNLFRVPRATLLVKGTDAILEYLRDRIPN